VAVQVGQDKLAALAVMAEAVAILAAAAGLVAMLLTGPAAVAQADILVEAAT
jgi:hypothetical protein